MAEETKFVTMELRDGRDWEWFPTWNVVAFRPGLDCAGKLAAIEDMQHTWRREHLKLVESA